MNIRQANWHNNEQTQWVTWTQGVSAIIDTSERIKWILAISEQEQVGNSHNRLNELSRELELEVKRIRDETSYNYDLEEHNQRLMQDYDKFQNTFEKLLIDNEKLWLIYEQLTWMFQNKPNWNQIIDKIKTEYLEQLVYECMDWLQSVMIDNIWEWFCDIKSGYELILRYKTNWIKYFKLNIRFDDRHLDKIFQQDTEAFIEFIKAAWESWIRSIYLWSNNLFNIFWNNVETFIKFIKTAWESWIRNVDLSWNGLNKIFEWNKKALIEFIKTAWESWIKVLSLYWNQLGIVFWQDKEAFVEFINKAWESWLINLNLWLNGLKFHYPQFIHELKKPIRFEKWRMIIIFN